MIKKAVLLSVLLALLPLDLRAANIFDLLRLDSLANSVEQELNNSGMATGELYNNINKAIMRVCVVYPAIERVDTVKLHKDMTGASLNNDFLRPYAAFKEITVSKTLVWVLRHLPEKADRR